jgi:hypothetical protein
MTRPIGLLCTFGRIRYPLKALPRNIVQVAVYPAWIRTDPTYGPDRQALLNLRPPTRKRYWGCGTYLPRPLRHDRTCNVNSVES